MAHFFQEFDGKVFKMSDSYATKTEAKRAAKNLRDSGNYWVRTIKVGKKWVNYRRTKVRGFPGHKII